MMLMEADILEFLRLWVQIEFTLPGIVSITDELHPFLIVGSLSFDEIRQIRGHHCHNIFNPHLID